MNKIINILKKKKTVSLDQFIDIALYDKKAGYYMKKNPFGDRGDFITSPLISILFSEMIAVWCISFWKHLGKPKKILIVELGPGDGSLCYDLLNTFKNFKKFYKCLNVKLLEKSNKLKKIQKIKITNSRVKWIEKLEDIKCGPAIFICNEFFDCLPIKQICKKENAFFERHVTLSDCNKKIKFLLKKTSKKLTRSLNELEIKNNKSIIEYPIESIKYLKIIAKKIKKYNGGLLAFDYGYNRNKIGETLQSVKKHKYQSVFLNPGNADITSHINFDLFCNILKKNDLDVRKIVNQNEFLQKMGIVERANMLSKKMNFKNKADLFYRLKRLNEMGNIFKVLFAQKKIRKFTLGF